MRYALPCIVGWISVAASVIALSAAAQAGVEGAAPAAGFVGVIGSVACAIATGVSATRGGN